MKPWRSLHRRSSLWRRITTLEPSHSLSSSSAAAAAAFCTDTHADAAQTSRFKVFDRDFRRKQLDRASWLMRSKDSFVDSVADNLLDRLEDCKKTFPTALCLGGSLEAVRRLLHGRGAIEKLIMMSASYDMVKRCRNAEDEVHNENIETSFMVGDEEFLPIKESSLDLVISCLGLHWTNDLPGAMIQCRLALKPDGLFLAAILGGETLKELRIACTVAQMEREGGISPRISPLAQVRDAGNLLTRAGFTLPGVDVDEYVVRYPSALDLIEHLRAMGETNALLQRNPMLKRDTALATAAIYDSMFAAEDGTIPATFQVIYMTGWREHSSQPRAKRRGSATVSFQDIQKQFGSETS
ncbi:putative methyltransferase At1g22800, mitochondrial [Argentina anserina]|uniref:putative methyltransferase At1g22800, mitochondrial n=1 Tax=Argentina anserina TaxID=57926 RepID=UPI00217663DA|nr:putative methyltransferase At1g22800, mitochondrial [Potentilla anserina]